MATKGDFIGFTFKGHHSSEFGITRVSDGSRYNDNLLPTFQDKTAVVAGGDGTYFWNSYFTQKPFPLHIAFDSLTEKQYRDLRQWLGTKEIHELIFDEMPYKKYMVKTQGAPQLKTICFDKEEPNSNSTVQLFHNHNLGETSFSSESQSHQRIYKGEGTINFVAYYPYARSVKKWLDEYDDLNKAEWAESSGMKDTRGDYDGTGSSIKLYNPGDVETDFCLYCGAGLTQIALNSADGILGFNSFSLKGGDSQVRINSKTNLVEGVDANRVPTGTLYNEYIKNGDFFKIPLGESTLTITPTNLTGNIEYDYLYF